MFWGAAAPQRRARTPRDDRGGEPRGQRHAGERDEDRLRSSWPTRGAMIARDQGGTSDQRLQREGSSRALILLAFAASILTQPATAKGHALLEPDLLDRQIA